MLESFVALPGRTAPYIDLTFQISISPDPPESCASLHQNDFITKEWLK
jgi:hypothetical protein